MPYYNDHYSFIPVNIKSIKNSAGSWDTEIQFHDRIEQRTFICKLNSKFEILDVNDLNITVSIEYSVWDNFYKRLLDRGFNMIWRTTLGNPFGWFKEPKGD